MTSPLRILIVEDNPVNQEFLAAVLEPHGTCICAESGEEALRIFANHGEPFDLILMDVMLPGIDGLQTIEKIRALEAARPKKRNAAIVVASSLDDDAKARRAFISGRAVSYMAKPFSVGTLLTELSSLGLIPRSATPNC